MSKLHKFKKDNEFFVGPKYGNYGKAKKFKRFVNTEKNMHDIINFKKILLVVFFALVLFATLLVLTQEKPDDVPTDTSDFESSVDSDETPEQEVDPLTGYPIYNETDYLYLVNKSNPLDEDIEIELCDFSNIQINVVMYYPLLEMVQQASEDGISLTFSTGYVSAQEQQILFENKVEELITLEGYTLVMADAKAEYYVPEPMTSDMQTGLCVEITGDADTFETSATYSWLVNNAANYGFVFRYPTNKQSCLESIANPLIIRYVGVDNAIKMRQLSMCMEEYMEYLN